MPFHDEAEAITYIFRSLRKLRGVERGLDEYTRSTKPTEQLLETYNLLLTPRQYAVVTGSKGKGSVTVITSKLLQYLGHTVGTMTSPHLVTWRERIRVNGRAIPQADLLRILDELAPGIDAIEATLSEHQYFSPQGIFLAIALRWFDEQGVNAAVLEVGRGGRYDDIAVVPNKLALFTPIMLEHTHYLGDTLARIAWHKAGIIEPYSYAYSLPQEPEVMEVLQHEAEAKEAEFNWVAPADMAQYVGETENGLIIDYGRYGEITLSLLGHYQIANATLATIAAGNMHGRLDGIPHTAPEYVDAIRAGLAHITWPGRVTRLQESPPVYVDGAINAESARMLVRSLENRWQQPVISIIAVPDDKDYAGVYRELGAVSAALILTKTTRNPILHFPPAETAVSVAKQVNANVSHAPNLSAALEQARARVGDGTIIIAGTQSIVADAMLLWGADYEVI